MPKHKNLQKGNARLMKNASAPRDSGDPRKARVETLKWLTGEGPMPEQFDLLFPEDEEIFERFTKDLWPSAEPDAKLGPHGVRFLLGAEDAQKDLLKSRAARLKAEKEALLTTVTEIEPKAVRFDRFVKAGHERGLIISADHEARCTKWKSDLRDYYTEYPLTRYTSYRTEADRLLHRDKRVKWTASVPEENLLRKEVLPPLLREMFPHLYA